MNHKVKSTQILNVIKLKWYKFIELLNQIMIKRLLFQVDK